MQRTNGALQGLEAGLVEDKVVGHGAACRVTGLRGEDGVGGGRIHARAPQEAFATQGPRRLHQQHAIDQILPAGLHQQGDDQQHIGGLLGLAPGQHPAADARMQQGLEPAALLRVAEHMLAQGHTVHPMRTDDIGAKMPGDGLDDLRIVGKQLVDHGIGVEHGHAAAFEQAGHGTLATGHAAGQADLQGHVSTGCRPSADSSA